MNRFEPKRPVYPIFAILSFFLFFPFGVAFATSSWIWFSPLAFLLVTLAFGYRKAFLASLVGLAIMIALFVGIVAITTRDAKAVEMASLRCAAVSTASIPMLGLSYTSLGKSLDTIKAPRSFSLAVMILFSFLPILLEERRKIREAYRVRGGNPHLPGAFFRFMVVPFLVRTISISDSLSLSLETRGFDLSQKPAEIYQPVLPKGRDWTFLLLVVALCVGTIALGLLIPSA